jgi:GAF domain-containing protein
VPDDPTPAAPGGDAQLAGQFRRLLAALDASGRALLPGSNQELLQSIVDASARIFGAAAASISLVDEEAQVLEFKVATGVGRDDVVGRRIPVDQGIAGYVAMTGQPIAVSNVQADPRFKHDFAQSTGYVPRSILATPLFSEGQVIGVMEVLDKINAAAFGLQDMELLGVFARQAALAIYQSQQYDKISGALAAGLRELIEGEFEQRPAALLAALNTQAADEAAADLNELAALFYAISSRGPAERKACLQILAAFGAYVSAEPRLD